MCVRVYISIFFFSSSFLFNENTSRVSFEWISRQRGRLATNSVVIAGKYSDGINVMLCAASSQYVELQGMMSHSALGYPQALYIISFDRHGNKRGNFGDVASETTKLRITNQLE